MQLSAKPSIRGALTAITAALLGAGAVHAAGENKVESSLLLYSEVNRVQAAEGIISFSRALKGDRLLNARLTLDGLTGASPNGATPSNGIQTFTRPSGNGSYTVPGGEIPLDDTFKDSRFGLTGSLTQPLSRVASLVFGSHLSAEHDYTSFGADVGFTLDLNRKNTTLSASLAYSRDNVNPEGGVPPALGLMPPPGENRDGGENENEGEDDGGVGSSRGKNVFDVVLGATQVLDRKTILRFNYSLDHSSGYLNDPYKLVSIVQSKIEAQPGEPVDYIYEARPGSRTKHALFAELRRYLGGHTVDLSYRYFWDTWGVTSHTVDVYYRLPLKSGHALEPHFRWYRQTEADFYAAYLVNGAPIPAHASADYRLAPFHAMTAGLQYLFPVADGAHFSVGAEYYWQVGDLSPPTAMGPLSQYDLFPNLNALMVRLGFSHDF